MPNKVEPGMRFRWKVEQGTAIFTVIKKAYSDRWLCSRADQPGTFNAAVGDVRYFEPIPECALGCNARTYNPICNAHAPKLANVNYGGWQGSNDEITWCAVPNREAANFYRYQRKVLVTSVQPIPEPAPELCAWGDGCGRPRSSLEHECNTETCWDADHGGCKRNNAGCHDFVAPQAKLCAFPAAPCTCADGTHRGQRWEPQAKPVMSPAQQQIAEAVKAANQQAKPVLREPKPGADGYPDVCLECRGEKPGRNFTCAGCFSLLPIPDFNRLTAGWRASQAKPAAKDIPSRLAGAVRALDRKIDTNETGPSAAAAAPGIEPWRPSVDDWDLLADAETGWRR